MMEFTGSVLINVLDAETMEVVDTIEQTNSITKSFYYTTLTNNTAITNNVYISTDIAPSCEDTGVMFNCITDGIIPAGVSSPNYFLSATPIYGQLMRRFAAPAVTRSITSVGIPGASPYITSLPGTNPGTVIAFVSLSSPCIQTSTQILDVYYRIQCNVTTWKTSNYYQINPTAYLLNLFGWSGPSGNALPTQSLFPIHTNVTNVSNTNPTAAGALFPNWSHAKGITASSATESYGYNHMIGQQAHNWSYTTIQGVGSLIGSISCLPGGVGAVSYFIRPALTTNNITAPNGSKIQPIFGHAASTLTSTNANPFMDVVPNTGSGSPSFSGTWEANLHPELYKIDIVTSGAVGTATYQFSKRNHIGFSGATYVSDGGSLPAAYNIKSNYGIASAIVKPHTCADFTTPRTVGGYYDSRIEKYDYYRFISYDMTGVTRYNTTNQVVETWDSTTIPALNATNIRQACVNPTDGSIWAACANTGIYRISADGLTITNFNTSNGLPSNACRAIDVGRASAIWAYCDSGMITTPDNGLNWTLYNSTASGGYSNYFNGTTDSLTIPSSSASAVGWVFTIEFWFNPAASVGNIIYCAGGVQIGYNGTMFSMANGTGWRMNSTTLPTLNTWNHIAIVRTNTGGTGSSIFINGSRTINAQTTDAFATNGITTIGSGITGYISNLRITKGTAIYDPTLTTLTVPTSPLSGIGSSLLTCQASSFVDNSGNGLVLTAVGTPSVQTLAPFGTPEAFYSPILATDQISVQYMRVDPSHPDDRVCLVRNIAITKDAGFSHLWWSRGTGLVLPGNFGGTANSANARRDPTMFNVSDNEGIWTFSDCISNSTVNRYILRYGNGPSITLPTISVVPVIGPQYFVRDSTNTHDLVMTIDHAPNTGYDSGPTQALSSNSPTGLSRKVIKLYNSIGVLQSTTTTPDIWTYANMYQSTSPIRPCAVGMGVGYAPEEHNPNVYLGGGIIVGYAPSKRQTTTDTGASGMSGYIYAISGDGTPMGGGTQHLVWETYGWDGTNWVLGSTTPKTTHSDAQPMLHGINVAFTNGAAGTSFVTGEYFTGSVNDGVLKNNAMTLSGAVNLFQMPTDHLTDFDGVIRAYPWTTGLVSWRKKSTHLAIGGDGSLSTYLTNRVFAINACSKNRVFGDFSISGTFNINTGSQNYAFGIKTDFNIEGVGVRQDVFANYAFNVTGTGVSTVTIINTNRTILYAHGGIGNGTTWNITRVGNTITFYIGGTLRHTTTDSSYSFVVYARFNETVNTTAFCTVKPITINSSGTGYYVGLGNSSAGTGIYSTYMLNTIIPNASDLSINGTPLTVLNGNNVNIPAIGGMNLVSEEGMLFCNAGDAGKTVTGGYNIIYQSSTPCNIVPV